MALRRCRQLVLVTLDEREVLEVQRMKCPQGAPVERSRSLRRALLQLATDYGVRDIVVEDDANVGSLLSCASFPIRLMSVATASLVLTGTPQASHADLFQMVLVRHPKLQRFVRTSATTGAVSMTDRWRTHVLLASALGLAALER